MTLEIFLKISGELLYKQSVLMINKSGLDFRGVIKVENPNQFRRVEFISEC